MAKDSPVIEIPQSQWYYRWGDSPLDAQGMPLWVYEGNIPGSEWLPMAGGSQLFSSWQENHFLWLMIRVPDGRWKHPALLLPPVSQNLEVYQNHQRVYRHGEFKPANSNRYWIIRSHLVPLENIEAETGSNTLFLRIYSDSKHIGMTGNRIWLGSVASLIMTISRLNIESFILGPLLSFIGLFSIFIYFRRRRQKLRLVLSFGAFAICIGIGNLLANPIIQLSDEAAFVKYCLAATSSLLWPVGLYIFVEQVLGRGYKSLVRRIWQFHILFAASTFLLDATNVIPLPSMIPLFFGLLMVGIFIGMPIAVKAAFKGNFEARILGAGMGIMMLSGMHDMLADFGVIPRWRGLFPWATLAFVLFLAYILEYRFAQARSQLEEYSLTLEQKVEERTQELKEAQSQIVMQAKMASLGDLVAGVAHDMNNPIGVIISTSDTANRGIHRIRELLQKLSRRLRLLDLNKQDLGEIGKDEEQLGQSLKLMETNQAVIATASDRVARIVQSLRSFARLDEALFQRVDIHDNLDTTLTLVQHELKNKAKIVKEYGEIPRIHCYPNELNQAFMNLLRNAAQAIEEQGVITISTHSDEAQVYIEVSDTGKGIPPEDLPRIFDPGFTTWGVGVGRGLGLSIVYNIVQKHQGDIKINSEVGKGTRITIALPI